ncbi:hypothetical protein KIN20_000789 [Parelaphostrongylus tenuis]|uniref:Uncharacterized protein n=1 Tax=Parelaphostrongylus tenuis TaxID=148309 RepID=A0AAD5LWS9_PARTN|nr:hypothetical protein KIN20_000789 [Parelaphostrongylus tenuis]
MADVTESTHNQPEAVQNTRSSRFRSPSGARPPSIVSMKSATNIVYDSRSLLMPL